FNTSTGNPVNEILLKLNLPDHRSILTDLKIHIKMDMERRSVKVKELQERCIIKAFKLSYQENYEHVGPKLQDHKMARLQDDVKRLCLVDDLKKFKITFISSLFSGIPIDSSLTLSHIFFVDDAIFVGKWDSLNIRTIINVLKCLHLASGLKINFHKSKHIGIVTRPEEVNSAATKIGCSIFTIHFVHLGVKVGGVISRIKSWDDVVAKVSSRLSKWKLKPLSIGLAIFSHDTCLWTRFIKAIYGKDDDLNSPSSLSKCSPWLDIIREVTVLRTKGINLLDLIRKKVGNGLNTLFWEDPWLDGLAGGAEEEQLGFLLSCMDGLILTNIPDRWVWSLEATSEFSIKFVRQLIDDSILPKEKVATRTCMIAESFLLSGAVSLDNPFNLLFADEDFNKGFNIVMTELFLLLCLKSSEDIKGDYNNPVAFNSKSVRVAYIPFPATYHLTGGLRNKQNEHKKAMSDVAKRSKIERSKCQKKIKQRSADEQFRGHGIWTGMT
ncbi:hypothetical protein Tco_0584154, partial [Tanacetum coccineum]